MILSGVKGNGKNTSGAFSQNGERVLLSRLEVQRETQGGRRRRVNNSLACVCRAPVSEERSSGSRSCGLASLTHPRCFCRSVRSGRATAASLLALPYCAKNREAEGDSSSERLAYFVQKESAVDRVFSRACVLALSWTLNKLDASVLENT